MNKRDAEIIQMVNDSMTQIMIAEKLNTNASSVNKVCMKYGIKSKVRPGRDRVTTEHAEKWHKLHFKDGMSGAAIARGETFTQETVNNWIKKHDKLLKRENYVPKTDLERAILSLDKISTTGMNKSLESRVRAFAHAHLMNCNTYTAVEKIIEHFKMSFEKAEYMYIRWRGNYVGSV
ncbi:MAG: hypothetical protein COA63_000985 [Methylophaga sp.]|nr:hypothetical protein [Methylophaga sp.]